jgi:D-alanyl-D-alanine carboxypeptidase (penicillin-binding protein 5/6)
MNNLSTSLRLTHTRFENPHGLDTEGQRTSAKDLAILGAEAFAIPMIAEAAGTQTYDAAVDGPNVRTLRMTSTVTNLGQPGILAGKTGSTPGAGGCIVQLSRTGNRRFVTALLGSTVQFDDRTRPIPGADQRYEDVRRIVATLAVKG